MMYLQHATLWFLLVIVFITNDSRTAPADSTTYHQRTLENRYSVTQARDILYHETPIIRLRSSIDTPSGLSCDLQPENFKLKSLETVSCNSWDAFQVNCIPAVSTDKLDLVFLLDDSGSMGDDIDAMKEQIIEFANILQNNNVDARFALITNSDEFIIESDFTTNPDDIKEQLDRIVVGGGHEMTLDSIIFALDALDYRSDTNLVFLCMTDEPSSIDKHTMPEVLQTLDKHCGMVISVSTNFNPVNLTILPDSTDMRLLAIATGGAWIDIAELSFSDIAFETINSVKARTWSYYQICQNPSCSQPTDGLFRSELIDSDFGLLTDEFPFFQSNLMTIDEAMTYDQKPNHVELHVSFPYEAGALPELSKDHFILLEEDNQLDIVSVSLISESTNYTKSAPLCQSYPIDICTFRIIAKSKTCGTPGDLIDGEIGFISNSCQYWKPYSYEKPNFIQLSNVSMSTDFGFPYREVTIEIASEAAYENQITRSNIQLLEDGVEQTLLEFFRLDDPSDPTTTPTFYALYLVDGSQEDGIQREVCVRYVDSTGCYNNVCSIYTPQEIPGCMVYITSPRNGAYFPSPEMALSGYATCIGTLPPKPMDFLFVVDASRSLLTTDPQDYRKIAALALLDSLDPTLEIRSGVIAFGDQSTILQPLTDDLDAVRTAIHSLDRDGGTQMARAITQAVDIMDQHSNPEAYRFIILFSDGVPTNPDDAIEAANESPVPIQTIFLGDFLQGYELMSTIAENTGGLFFQAQDPSQLPSLFLNYNRQTYIHKIEIGTSADANFNQIIPASQILDGQWNAQNIPLTPLLGSLTTIKATLHLQGNPSYQRHAIVNVFYGTPSGMVYIGM